MKMKQTENNITLYFLQKRNYRRSKENFEKLEIFIVKREAAGMFVIEMMFSGEIYDNALYQMILRKKIPACQARF